MPGDAFPYFEPVFALAELFELSQTAHAGVFDDCNEAWEALPKIAGHLASNLQPAIHGDVSPDATIGEQVYIGEGTVVEAGAMIAGPAIIGARFMARWPDSGSTKPLAMFSHVCQTDAANKSERVNSWFRNIALLHVTGERILAFFNPVQTTSN